MREISTLELLLIIIVSFIIGHYLYKISKHANVFQPNVGFLLQQMQDEFQAISDELVNPNIDSQLKLRLTARAHEIRMNLNKFVGCQDENMLDIPTLTCKA